MYKLLISIVSVGAILSAADIAGTWQGEQPGQDGKKREFYYVFKGDGGGFTGRMITDRDQREIANGVVDGNHVTFDLRPWAGTGRFQQYKGELSGDQLKIVPAVTPAGRTPMELTLRRTSASTDFKPPPSLARAHQPFPPLKPIPSNGLAQTPPMGWNSWNKFHRQIDDKTVREIADAMVKSGMKDAGYAYVNIDDTWEAGRDAKGNITTNTKFPDMKALADYVHSKGLKLGIYSGPGRLTCAGYEASYGHEDQDAATFAGWGVDYLKYDWCSASAVYTPDEMASAYQKMALALRKSGRPMVYSLCQYGLLDVGEWGAAAGGNLWRTTGDISDRWESMARIGFGQNGREKVAGPGRWNDPDMLEIGNGGMTDTEYRTHMSLWAILAAPLLAGNDLRSMSDATVAILTNKEVIAVDQDKLGQQGVRVKQDGELEIWKRTLSDGSAVGLFNRGAAAARMTVRWADIGVKEKLKVRDLWAHADVGAPVDYSVEVPSHGVVMLRVW
jgi:alpha-galactosidase